MHYSPWIEVTLSLLGTTSFVWLPFGLIVYIVFVGLWWPIILLVALWLFFLAREHHVAPLVEPDPVRANKEHKWQLLVLVSILVAILAYNYFEYGI